MDHFPEDFSLKNCMKTIEENQKYLKNDTRQLFYQKVIEGANMCSKTIELSFPENLWPEHRVVIAKEVLDMFGEVYVSSSQPLGAKTTKVINESNEIPTNIDGIKIVFFRG